MSTGSNLSNIVRPTERLIMIVGNYGSGKTEVSVNLCIAQAAAGRRTQMADLDIVNPYFRSREARESMERYGVRVVVPPGAQAWADLPIVLPEIQGMIQPPEGTLTVFDVGGDDVGARVLASLRHRMTDGHYELWQVINSRRPFTDTVDGCMSMRRDLEQASRLSVTGLLVNSHLIEETTPGIVVEGFRLAREVAEQSKLPIRCVAAMDTVCDSPEIAEIEAPLLRMRRHMLPPWLAPPSGGYAAARPTPIGTPPRIRLIPPGGKTNG
jgi:hypothetical protein